MWELLENSKVPFLLNLLNMAILSIFVICWISQCLLQHNDSLRKKKSLKFVKAHFSSLLIQRSALLLVQRKGFSGVVLIIGSCTERSVKLALLWHCVIGYSFCGAGDSRRCDVTSPVCGGGVTLVHLGVSDNNGMWKKEPLHTQSSQKNHRHWWCHSITESFPG